MRTDPDMASAVAAIRTLLEFLRRDKGGFGFWSGEGFRSEEKCS